MFEHAHELLHAAVAGLFILSGVLALSEYRHLRERVVLAYFGLCIFAGGYACYIVISHNLPKTGAFWVPWTSVGLALTFGATSAYLATMQRFLEIRGRLFSTIRTVQGLITGFAVSDVLLYAITRHSMMFVSTPRPGLSAHQLALGEGAYSLLPMADVVGALFGLSFVVGTLYLLVHLVRQRSHDILMFTGLVATSIIILNDTLVALEVYAGVYLIGLSKAFESLRIHRDIATRARERMEARLRQAEKMEAIGQVAGGIAHDFNNILHAVGARLELAADTLGEAHPAAEDLNAALESVGVGRTVVRQLLDLARSNHVSPQYIDINEFLSASSGLLSAMIRGEARLKIIPDPEVGGVTLPRGQLTQVLMNLVVNASEAMPTGGTITIRAMPIEAVLNPSAGGLARPAVLISVTDEGSGIPPDVLKHVFEPFFSTKSEHGGTGLGLPTIQAIVQEAGGHIDVDSKRGKGTRFDLVLPRTPRPEAATAPRP